MNIKAALSLPFAKYIVNKNKKWKNNALIYQKKVFENLVIRASKTQFGKDHNFSEIKKFSYDFDYFIGSRPIQKNAW